MTRQNIYFTSLVGLAVCSGVAGYFYHDNEVASLVKLTLLISSGVIFVCTSVQMLSMFALLESNSEAVNMQRTYITALEKSVEIKDELLDEFEELIITKQELKMPPNYWSNERVARVKARLDKKVEQGIYKKVILPESPLLPFEEWA